MGLKQMWCMSSCAIYGRHIPVLLMLMELFFSTSLVLYTQYINNVKIQISLANYQRTSWNLNQYPLQLRQNCLCKLALAIFGQYLSMSDKHYYLKDVYRYSFEVQSCFLFLLVLTVLCIGLNSILCLIIVQHINSKYTVCCY